MAKLKNIKLVSLGKYLSKYELSYETNMKWLATTGS